MIKHVLVATDGSRQAQKALGMAARLAKATSAHLTILHVVPPNATNLELGRSGGPGHILTVSATMPRLWRIADDLSSMPKGEISETALVSGQRLIEEACNEAQGLGAYYVYPRLETGDCADTILDVAREINADIIAVGNRGSGVLEGLMLGSISKTVSKKAHCSVLVVR